MDFIKAGHLRLRIVTVVVIAFVALTAWGLSSPPGSSPDDDFHLSSIWCGQGERAGLCESISESSVRVPGNVVGAPCFAFHSDITGACQTKLSPELVETNRANAIGHPYPGGYYWVMSWLAGPNVLHRVLLMRMVNVAVFLLLSVLAFVLVAPKWRTALAVSIGVTIVPLGLFIIPSTNPSSWAIYPVAFSYLLARTLAHENRIKQSLAISAALVLNTVVLSSARADAAIFGLFAFGIALLPSFMSWRKRVPVYLLGALLTIITAFSALAGRQSGSAIGGLVGPSGGGSHSLGLLFGNLLQIPTLYTGTFGGWALGWFDTSMPAVVPTIMTLMMGGVIFGAIALKRTTRELVVPGVLLGVMVLVPLIISQGAGTPIGTFIQPRYVLPLMVLALVALLSTSTERFLISQRQVALCFFLIGFASVVSLLYNLKRYTIGDNTGLLTLNAGSWQPPGTAFGVLGLGTVATISCLVLIYRWYFSSDRLRLGSID